jgi:hypothetical protein
MPIDLERSYPTVKELQGEIHNVRRLADPDTKEWSATNLSVGYHESTGYIGMFRSGNYIITERGKYTVTDRDFIRSKIYIAELNPNTYKLKNVRLLDVVSLSEEGPLRRGLEDPKLFYRDDAWHFSCVTLEKNHTEKARMAVCKLNKELTEIVEFKKLAGVDISKPEKNWMTTDSVTPYFDWIYASNALVKDSIVTYTLSDKEQTGSLRGNTNLHLLKDGTYLAVMHRMWSKIIMEANIRHYVHYFVNFDQRGVPIKMSKGFVFEHLGTEFAAGLCEQDENFLISYGSKDVSSHIALLPKETVLKSLQTIKD